MNQERDGHSFEGLRAQMGRMQASSADSERVVRFLDESKALGYSRDRLGRIEIMLAGPHLVAASANTRSRMRFDDWLTADGSTLPANRLVLETGEQFDAAGALICVELTQQGYQDDPEAAFSLAEPVIEMVMARADDEAAAITGLAGELLVLDWLTTGLSLNAADAVIEAWHGWRPSSRDLQLGRLGVEVKTTATSASVHHIQGWHQVEVGPAVDGTQETALFLLSIGVRWLGATGDAGTSIRHLSSRIAGRLTGLSSRQFLARVRAYGGIHSEVDAEGLVNSESTRRRFVTTFERLYDMSDPRIRVLRRGDLTQYPSVVTDSVKFSINLPNSVRGDLNPVVGRRAILAELSALG